MPFCQANNNKLPSNLPQLQNLIKRDAASYTEEFERQHAVYKATCAIFEQNPTVYNNQLHEIIMFLAQVAQFYPEQLNEFPQELVAILKRHASVLHPHMRMSLVKALMFLRNKNLISPLELHMLFFQLLRCQDKALRKFLQQHIITDIKNINAKGKNMKLNKELQNFMYEMLTAKHAVASKTALDIMIELYNKRIWNDAKTVNIITVGCFSKVTKIMVAAIKFFIGKDEEEKDNDGSDSESDEEDCNKTLKTTMMAVRVNKKSKKNANKLAKVKSVVKKNMGKKKKKDVFDFSALHLIHDPQDLADKLYKRLEKMNERFEVKLLVMNFISRLIGIHQLYLPNFYPLLQRFLFPHQQEVTKVMVFAAQAAHPLASPDDLEPLVRTLANNFVTERYSNEVMAMGLNAIRELCARNPHGMTEDLLQDLAQYKSSKDKGVSTAAKSLIVLYREVKPELLAKKDRGAPTELRTEEGQQEFGGNIAKGYIPGAEVLTFKTRNDDMECDESDDEEEEKEEDEGEEEDDDEWVDMDDSKDGSILSEGDEKIFSNKEAINQVMKLTAKERAEKAADIASSRFLTDEDFQRIAAVQAAKQVELYSGSKKIKNAKRKLENIDKPSEGEIVPLKSIEMIYKKRKHDKAARMETVLAGREGREKFGSRKGQRMNPDASKTNKMKAKTKNYMMVKHKVAHKQKVSFRDKQMKLRNSLLKQRKNY
ncbi:protein SDA1 homolog [Penaeus monodon]|uniref:protein SDA1 homolog n=1 Tax=Penaeus monodon TaxID=6687 RepID=UPI0018A6E918|nr:protein SDA1 homolog [Penaeus monodon]XP_037785068.1 protein SDA1 homolog [Penaeus monodon]